MLDEKSGVGGVVVEQSPAPELISVLLGLRGSELLGASPAIQKVKNGHCTYRPPDDALHLPRDRKMQQNRKGACRDGHSADPGQQNTTAHRETGHGCATPSVVAQQKIKPTAGCQQANAQAREKISAIQFDGLVERGKAQIGR